MARAIGRLTDRSLFLGGVGLHRVDLVGAEVSLLEKTTLKKHNPKTSRKNVGKECRECLSVRVRRSADLYRRVEGWWYGIVVGADR